MKKYRPLSTIFYRNFILLIVIPILVVIIIAMGIIQKIMIKSSMDKIELAQKNIKTTIENEILDSSLRLTHFLLTNDNRVLEYAARHNMSEGDDKYGYSVKLKEQFNLMMMPKTDILAIHFYMNDGSYYDLKDNLAFSSEIIKKSKWYQKALKQPKLTYIGSEKSNIIFSQKRRISPKLTLAVAMAPDNLDRYKKIEMVSMYVVSKATDMIKEYNKKSELGKIYLIDTAGEILIGEDLEISDAILKDILAKSPGVYLRKEKDKRFHYIINTIESTDWKVINIVETHELLQVFYQVSLGIITTALLLFILFFLFSRIFLKNILAPVSHLAAGMELIEQGDLKTQVKVEGGVREIRKLIHSFNRMAKELSELIVSNQLKEQEKHQEEIKALQSQINPHFLVNTLSSIRFIAITAKFESIKQMAEALIKILSCSFRSENSLYTVKEEIEMLESYVFLMKIRYSNSFEVHFDIEERSLDCLVPRLILQPILENAIVHGFNDLEEMGFIEVRVYEEENTLVFDIKDNGQGMSKEMIKEVLTFKKPETSIHKGIGISNVNRRIKLNYGIDYGIEIKSEVGAYTQAAIKIPVAHKGESKDV